METEYIVMDINHEHLKMLVGSRAHEVPDLLSQYETLMRVLHGEEFSCSDDAFDEILKSPGEAIIFVSYEDVLLASAQVSLINTFPKRQAVVNNVVVDPKYQGLGLGKILMARVQMEAEAKWRDERGLRIFLTNNPNEKNAGFYQKLGFTPRTQEVGNPTVVWEIVS